MVSRSPQGAEPSLGRSCQPHNPAPRAISSSPTGFRPHSSPNLPPRPPSHTHLSKTTICFLTRDLRSSPPCGLCFCESL